MTLDALDELALRRILTEPRNALVRQFQKILNMDGVDLQFTKEALDRDRDQGPKPQDRRRGCVRSSKRRCSRSCTTCRRCKA